MSMKEIVFRDLRRSFSISVLPIKYPSDFHFGCQYMYGTLNVHFLNIRLTPYPIFYIHKYFRLLYKDIGGGRLCLKKSSKAVNTIVRLRKGFC
jgi:hypothetical protein